MLLVLAGLGSEAQADSAHAKKNTTKTWFDTHVVIGQSLSTIINDTKDPAQFQATFPKKDTASYVVNLGISVVIDQFNGYLLKATGEYHRNTTTDSAQNNLQLGLTLQKLFAGGKNWAHGLTSTVKYAYDGIAITNSLAVELYYIPLLNNGTFNLNTNTYLGQHSRVTVNVSPYIGGQLQDVFDAKSDSAKGLIIRPVFSLSGSIAVNKKLPHSQEGLPEPMFQLSGSYTGRWDVSNTTQVKEGYTNLFTVALDYFILTKPIKLSVGPSFHVGSDPLQGLKDQQYWMISLNVSKFLK